jgi:uncharacterized protein with von Willebrand factor type A (vWA) domain
MRLNKKRKDKAPRTHEGAPAYAQLTPEQKLRRSLLSCMLWEREFYEDGRSIAESIEEAARVVAPERLAEIAVEARSKFNLRHAPLLLLAVLTETGAGKRKLVAETIEATLQRADELAEFMTLYWERGRAGGKNKKPPLSAQVKKGLAAAFERFDAYELAKYNRDSPVKLRDVMFMVHPKPKDEAQAALWRKLAERELESPDTWEVALSGGADKKETFTRLVAEGKLGYLALLRNLRNMVDAGVDQKLIAKAIMARKGAHRVLPFRYVAAARACPRMEKPLDEALQAAIGEQRSLDGTTLVLVDVSGSMEAPLSRHSDLTRMDAAAALASIVRADELNVFTFSNDVVEVPSRRGMAGVDAVVKSQSHGGTELGKAVAALNTLPHDRLIVITDEQSHDRVPDPVAPLAYIINVASYRSGIGYGRWIHVDGFSEAVLRFMHEYEAGFGPHGVGHA